MAEGGVLVKTVVERKLEQWQQAALIDAATAENIRAFEVEHGRSSRVRWQVMVAIAFGAVLIGAGVLLFVAAHWDELSPAARFTLVCGMVLFFHFAGAAFTRRGDHNLATAMHAIGTATLGAGIFLAGQIFNLEEHWPGAFMLWSAGALCAWLLLRDTAQAILLAILAPVWLAGEWSVLAELTRFDYVAWLGLTLLALVYLGAPPAPVADATRRALAWVGGLTLIPLALIMIFAAHEASYGRAWQRDVPALAVALGYTAAVVLPLLVAWVLRKAEFWPAGVAAVWLVVMAELSRFLDPERNILVYFWAALGAIGLITWGMRDQRRERVNLGVAIFALTVIFFYFSNVMDKLGRSTSMIVLGLLFLGGGRYLEKTRRHLLRTMEGRSV
jgi:uncharacterized membrane protein